MTLLIAILTKNASFRSYGTFAYLLCAHIRNINMPVYTTSAHRHQLMHRVKLMLAWCTGVRNCR